MTAATRIPERRRGVGEWLAATAVMIRHDAIALRSFLVVTFMIQTLMGAGMGLMYGLYLGEIPPEAATFLVSGIPALALFPIGFVLVPGVISDQRWEETYDYTWSLPVPRSSAAVATLLLFTLLALPGTALALTVSALAYDVTLSPSWAIVPAVLGASAMATSVGYAFGHGIKNPRLTNLITNALIFGVLMFTPIVVPIEQFPDGLAAVHRVLPFWHMAEVLRSTLTEGFVDDVATHWLVLGVWTVASWGVALRVISRRG
jgi:ABC-2 type transport system permease protein